MDCFFVGRKSQSGERNVVAPKNSISLLSINKPMILPEPQQAIIQETEDNLYLRPASPASLAIKKQTQLQPVSASYSTEYLCFPATKFVPPKMHRSGSDRTSLPGISASCNAAASSGQIWPANLKTFHLEGTNQPDKGNIGSRSRSGSTKGSLFRKKSSLSSRHISVPQLQTHEAYPLPAPSVSDQENNIHHRYAGEARDESSLGRLVSIHATVEAALYSYSFRAPKLYSHRLPLPSEVMLQKKTSLRAFACEELFAGCGKFSSSYLLRETCVGPVYRSTVKGTGGNGEKMIFAVTCLRRLHLKDEDEWNSFMAKLFEMDSPNVCKLWGYCNLSSSEQLKYDCKKMLVFEHMENDSLNKLLLRRKNKRPLGWLTRLKIALGTAKGLTYLRGKYPSQIFYKDFSMLNIQIDKDGTPKLSDYGLLQLRGVNVLSQDDPELTPEEEVLRSFGKVLLGLLACQGDLEKMMKGEEYLANLVKRISTDMRQMQAFLDPALQDKDIAQFVKRFSQLTIECLQEKAALRLKIEDAAKILASIQDAHNVTPMNNTSGRDGTNSEVDTADRKSTLKSISTKPICTQPIMYELPQIAENTSLEGHKAPLLSESGQKRLGWQQATGNSLKGSMGHITWVTPKLKGSEVPAESSSMPTKFLFSFSFLKNKLDFLGTNRHKIQQLNRK